MRDWRYWGTSWPGPRPADGPAMDLYPAIDLRDGNCVRLYQGDYDRETVYGQDPAGQAAIFDDAGSSWVHVVDLDAARSGRPGNRAHVAAIADAVRARVQTGGGVRSVEAADALFAAGVDRVVIGTAALEQPELVRRLTSAGRGVAVGVDVRGREVAVRGWESGSGRDVIDVADEFADAGVEALIMTQISQDGTLEGPDIEGLSLLLSSSAIEVVASGGVGTLDHLRQLRDLEVGDRRLHGVIVGRALYEGRFTIGEALEACRS
jgi:phosphoribosylformimino-5-aminoimidazole carboxamide ribotide isomerase